jgi:hypothetical protein
MARQLASRSNPHRFRSRSIGLDVSDAIGIVVLADGSSLQRVSAGNGFRLAVTSHGSLESVIMKSR